MEKTAGGNRENLNLYSSPSLGPAEEKRFRSEEGSGRGGEVATPRHFGGILRLYRQSLASPSLQWVSGGRQTWGEILRRLFCESFNKVLPFLLLLFFFF